MIRYIACPTNMSREAVEYYITRLNIKFWNSPEQARYEFEKDPWSYSNLGYGLKGLVDDGTFGGTPIYSRATYGYAKVHSPEYIESKVWLVSDGKLLWELEAEND